VAARVRRLSRSHQRPQNAQVPDGQPEHAAAAASFEFVRKTPDHADGSGRKRLVCSTLGIVGRDDQISYALADDSD
jgi:hypothetical protein